MIAKLLFRFWRTTDKALKTASRLNDIFWVEVLWAFTSPSQREAITRDGYGQDASSYLPGGQYFEGGFFDWERVAVTSPPFPQSGRILLGGAGAGRELKQFCLMGFDVVAFEPYERFFRESQQVVQPWPRSSTVLAGYRDLVDAAMRHSGPLAGSVSGRFDAVVCGWASFTHLATAEERRDLLRAIRAIAPEAPVLLSFFCKENEGDRVERSRRLLRRLLRAMGVKSTPSPGTMLHPEAGFVYLLTANGFHSDAEDSGYDVAYLKLNPYPHAMLTPK